MRRRAHTARRRGTRDTVRGRALRRLPSVAGGAAGWGCPAPWRGGVLSVVARVLVYWCQRGVRDQRATMCFNVHAISSTNSSGKCY